MLDTYLRQVISSVMAWKYRIVPDRIENDILFFFIEKGYVSNRLHNELKILTGKNIRFKEIDTVDIDKYLSMYYPQTNSLKQTVQVKVGDDNFIFQLIKEAKELRSSDIHVEPQENQCRVRIRVDGKLLERYIIPKKDYPAVLNKFKILARLDISEKRLPQDGRINFNQDDYKFDIRVSVLPTLYGEKVVLRILSNDASNVELKELGFNDKELSDYEIAVAKPHGIVLISGPTGSGKTTTLYATLKKLNSKTKNIVTIEDPVEYTLEGINQVQLKDEIGLDFTRALKTFLRQDPDIIMVGEIRDADTAQMAIRAALTGHLVLSTIHTNSAWGIISRLIDMGIPSYMVANTMNLAVAQRLVRLLCDKCKKEVEFSDDLVQPGMNIPEKLSTHFLPVGCPDCLFTGYKGRKAIYEVIPITGALRDMIKNQEYNISKYVKENKIGLLSEQAFLLIKDGQTSFEEAYSFLFQE